MISTCAECSSRRATLSFHSTSEVPALVQRLEEAMHESGYSDKDVFAVRLALEEALVNAIKHGHKYDRSKRAVFRYEVTDECVRAEVEDEGRGFRPEDVPDPLAEENLEKAGGRGLFLMRAYMTSVSYNERGNRVTMYKRRS